MPVGKWINNTNGFYLKITPAIRTKGSEMLKIRKDNSKLSLFKFPNHLCCKKSLKANCKKES